MINSKSLVKLARKWQKVPSIGRRRISSRSDRGLEGSHKSVADKGHFVVYSEDGERFEIPLCYLNKPIFREILKMAEDEFGLTGNGPIRLPCDANFLGFIVSLLQRSRTKEVEQALFISMRSGSCSSSLVDCRGKTFHQEILHVF